MVRIFVAIALCLPNIVASVVADRSPARVERLVRTMGTQLRVVVEARHRDDALPAGERAVAAVVEAERRLSTWTSTSELSRVNAAAVGHAVQVSPELARDLTAAVRCSETTAGAFTPGAGSLIRAWGLREGGRRPSALQIDEALDSVRAANLRVDGEQVTRLHPNLIVEEGAFGKGVALDDASAAFEQSAATGAVLDLGGQVMVLGGATATIGIADPRQRSRLVLQLEVPHGSVATSGNSERGIVVDGRRLGHILDPRTGRPATDFGSMTVWSESATTADCLSTGLYVLGPRAASCWAADRDDIALVALEVTEHQLVAHVTEGLRDRLRVLVDDVVVHEFTGGQEECRE